MQYSQLSQACTCIYMYVIVDLCHTVPCLTDTIALTISRCLLFRGLIPTLFIIHDSCVNAHNILTADVMINFLYTLQHYWLSSVRIFNVLLHVPVLCALLSTFMCIIIHILCGPLYSPPHIFVKSKSLVSGEH